LLLIRAKQKNAISASEIILKILYDANNIHPRIRALNIFVIVDILNVLRTAGSQKTGELLNKLHTVRKHSTLSSYLTDLVNLKLVSRKEMKHSGAIPMKFAFDITEKGELFLSVMESL